MSDETKVPSLNADVESLRGLRLPILDGGDTLWFPEHPGKYRYWQRDVKNEVQNAIDSGFTFVMQEQLDREAKGEPTSLNDPRDRGTGDDRVSVFVGRAHTKENATAYLMEMDIDRWRAIKQLIAEERMAPVKQLRRDNKELQGQAGFYGPGMRDDLKIR